MSGADHDRLRQVGTDVRAALQPDAGADRLRQRAAVVAAASAAATPSRQSFGWAWAGVGAVALCAAAVLWMQRGETLTTEPAQTAVAASLDQAPHDSGGTLERSTPAPAHHPGTAPQVLAPLAPLELAPGTVELAPDEERQVVAGPYTIDVGPGDRVAFTWEPAEPALEVRVQAGSVELHVATAVHTITAGQMARAAGSKVVITSARAVEKAPDKPEGRPDNAWKRLAKDGRYADALAAATRAGALKTTGSVSKSELKLLADVARLGGAPDQSTAVLQSLRRRFPKSREARRAAFYLGRQAEREARLKDAASWYRTYLEGTAQGSLRTEARGRLLGVLRRGGEGSAARSVAREVLRDDPQGAYVDLARKTLGDAP